MDNCSNKIWVAATAAFISRFSPVIEEHLLHPALHLIPTLWGEQKVHVESEGSLYSFLTPLLSMWGYRHQIQQHLHKRAERTNCRFSFDTLATQASEPKPYEIH